MRNLTILVLRRDDWQIVQWASPICANILHGGLSTRSLRHYAIYSWYPFLIPCALYEVIPIILSLACCVQNQKRLSCNIISLSILNKKFTSHCRSRSRDAHVLRLGGTLP